MKVHKIKEIKKWHNSIDIKIVEQGIVEGDKSWNYHRVESPFHRLYFIKRGEVFIKEGKNIHCLKQGMFYFMKRNTTMDYYAMHDFEKYYIHFQCAVYGNKDLLDEAANFCHIALNEKDINHYIAMFLEPKLANYFEGMGQLQYIIKSIVMQNNIDYISHRNKFESYQQVINFIKYRNSMKITVEEMATIHNQSVSHFSKEFKKVLGVSPKAFVHDYIMEQAKNFLLLTEKSVKEISKELGFDDSLYFSRFFKNKTGYSPMKYRKRSRMS